jgi:hypothetical protein
MIYPTSLDKISPSPAIAEKFGGINFANAVKVT